MANDKDFKVKNGIKPTAYHEAVGTVVSGTEGYSVAGAEYQQRFSVGQNVRSASLNDDGTKMFVTSSLADTIREYTLSTAYDISTASYVDEYTVQGTSVTASHFRADGLKFYTMDAITELVYQYSMSTAWDISTSSYDSKSFSVASQDTVTNGIYFKPDGTKMYVTGYDNDSVYEYSLSTAWDVSTASYTTAFSTATQVLNPRGISFNADGSAMYIGAGAAVYIYSLGTSWDVSTSSYVTSLTTNGANSASIQFGNSGAVMIIADGTANAVDQYSTVAYTQTLDLSTGSVFEITPTSDIQVALSNPADSGTVSGATLLLDGVGLSVDVSGSSYADKSVLTGTYTTYNQGMFLRPGGTDVYVTDTAGGYRIVRYSLSTAYDMSTATYTSQYTGHTGYEQEVRGIYFKPDGLQMYVIGSSSDDVHQFTLSTAWDITTASFTQTRTLTGDTFPMDLTFKTDGTKFYVLGGSTNTIYEYDMSTAWDISTANSTADRSYSGISSQSTGEQGLDFSEDGTQMFYLANTFKLYQYTLSTAWDVSTASYDSIVYDGSGTFSDVGAVSIRNSQDEGLMYVSNSSGSASTAGVYQFNLGLTAPTITYPTNITWPGGTAPTSPAIGDTDVIIFTTRDGGTTYNAALAIDGAQ